MKVFTFQTRLEPKMITKIKKVAKIMPKALKIIHIVKEIFPSILLERSKCLKI
jgi:hypothetical protein